MGKHEFDTFCRRLCQFPSLKGGNWISCTGAIYLVVAVSTMKFPQRSSLLQVYHSRLCQSLKCLCVERAFCSNLIWALWDFEEEKINYKRGTAAPCEQAKIPGAGGGLQDRVHGATRGHKPLTASTMSSAAQWPDRTAWRRGFCHQVAISGSSQHILSVL